MCVVKLERFCSTAGRKVWNPSAVFSGGCWGFARW